MSKTQKDLYLEIKSAINGKDFTQACALCEKYVEEYPTVLDGWLSYILAFCEVKTTKELVKCPIDFTKTDIYEKALENLEEADREKLTSFANAVTSARQKVSSANATNQESLVYFVKGIKEIRAKMEDVKTDIQACIDQDKASFKNKRKSYKLFGNNVFSYFLMFFVIALPFMLLHSYFAIAEMGKTVQLIPLIVGAIVFVIILLSKRAKQSRAMKQIEQAGEEVLLNETRIVVLGEEVKELTVKHKKMMKIYKFCKKHPRLKAVDLEKLRNKFDAAYNGL